MKTNELTGVALDWAIILCEKERVDSTLPTYTEDGIGIWLNGYNNYGLFHYSSNWAHGGPIIEREKVFVKPTINRGWRCYQRDPAGNGICHSQYGPTPLVAAMRCYVASKLGDDIDLPKELT